MIRAEKNWKRLIVMEDLNIRKSLIKLNTTSSQILIVCSLNGVLKGTVTDGDIRRGLINGFSLKTSISKIYNKKPFYIYNDAKLKKLQKLQKLQKLIDEYKIRIIPIVNQKNKLVGVYDTEEKAEHIKIENEVIIMAGGKGQRLRPITSKTPKPMIKINGKPILEKLILNCKDAGFQNFYISVNYLKSVIKKYLYNNKNLGVDIKYINEKKPLGTVGSISLIKKKILEKKKPIIIINGDIIANFNLAEILYFHNKNKSSITVVSSNYEFQNPYGVIKTNKFNNLISIKEKPVYSSEILAGIYVIDYKLLNLVPQNKVFNMPDLINLVLKKKKNISNYKMDKYWHEVGNINQYNSVLEYFN